MSRSQGTTIVQVTHAEANVAYGGRIIKLRDGFMEQRRMTASLDSLRQKTQHAGGASRGVEND